LLEMQEGTGEVRVSEPRPGIGTTMMDIGTGMGKATGWCLMGRMATVGRGPEVAARKRRVGIKQRIGTETGTEMLQEFETETGKETVDGIGTRIDMDPTDTVSGTEIETEITTGTAKTITEIVGGTITAGTDDDHAIMYKCMIDVTNDCY